jgi:hypothetical protein
MKKIAQSAVTIVVSAVTLWLLLEPSAWAVPSYSRRYGVECSTCHTMWGSLNGAGATFRLSGYRAIFGKPMKPEVEDTEISKGVTIPATLPLSFITGVGVDSRSEKREVTGGSSVTSNGSTLALEDASIFMTSPLGEHLSTFVEFPMYETRAWEFTPTGNFEARYNTNPGRQIQFGTESPAFEVAKFFWNNLLGDTAPRDSVNLLAGITHLPMGYPTGKVRLSVNQYLVYERTALDLISPRAVKDGVVAGDSNDFLFRLSEPQILAEVNGMLTFGKSLGEAAKRDTFWAEYHLGVTNGSNAKADNNTQKDVYGRWVMRWYNQTLGFFGIRSADAYSDNLRTTGSTGVNTVGGTGIMSGAQDPNKTRRFGPDLTLSLVPFGIPVWLENAVMYNSESNPTGFGQEFKWKGGLHQLNWQISKTSMTYARLDWLKGDAFNDTALTVNGNTGITNSTPKEHDWILGYQHLYEQNIKLVAEFRHHTFEDTATGPVIPTLGVATNPAKLSDNGFTLRAMFGF